MFDITENAKIVSIFHPADRSGSALATEWTTLKYGQKVTFVLDTGSLATSYALTLAVANGTAGTKSTTITSASSTADLEFPHYYLQGTGSSIGVFVKTSVSSSTVTIASTIDSRLIIIEVAAKDLGQFLSSSVAYDASAVRVVSANPAGGALQSLIGIVTDYRYQQDSPPSSL